MQNKPIGREETPYKHFLLFMSSNFRNQHFVVVCGSLGGKVPVSDDVLSFHEEEIYPAILLDEFQTYRSFYVDLRQICLAVKLKLVKSRSYDTYKTKEF